MPKEELRADVTTAVTSVLFMLLKTEIPVRGLKDWILRFCCKAPYVSIGLTRLGIAVKLIWGNSILLRPLTSNLTIAIQEVTLALHI